MTRGKRVNPEFLEAASLTEAIAKLEALKRERVQGETGADAVQEAKASKQGKPPKQGRQVKSGSAEVEAPPGIRVPTIGPPAKRGRKQKEGQAVPAPAASFGVNQPTAHRPLGLLEVQESSDLDALLADPRLAGQIAMRLDDRFALVLPASLERLQAALLKAGHTPKLSSRGKA